MPEDTQQQMPERKGRGKRLTGWAVRVLLASLTVLVLMGAFIAWRVAQEPVSLAFAIPTVEEALSAADGSYVVRLGGFQLRRDGLAFVFEAQDLAVLHGDGEGRAVGTPLAVLPIAEISLSLGALVQEGVLAPERVTASGLLVTAQRDAQGIEVLLAERGEGAGQGIRLSGLRELLQTDPRLRHLKSVELNRLTFRVVDPLLGFAWQTEGTSMRLVNEPDGFKWEGLVGFSAPRGMDGPDHEDSRVQWSLTFPPETAGRPGDPATAAEQSARLAVQFDRLDPVLAIDLIPGLDKVIGWQGPVSGAVSTQFGLQQLPSDIRFVLRAGQGRLALPASGGHLDYRTARAVGRLRLADRALEMDELTVTHAGGTLRLQGNGAMRGRDDVRVQLSASGAQVAWLASLVPAAAVLEGADLTLAADIDADLRLDGGIGHADLHLRAEPGTLALPGLLPEPVRLEGGALDLRIADNGRSFALRRLNLAIARQGADEPLVIEGSGAGQRGGEAEIAIATSALGIADLKRLWPKGLGEAARIWVEEQVHDGRVEPAETAIRFRLPEGEGLPAPADVRVESNLPIRDLTLTYWPPLPDATGIDAEARLTEKLFEATVTGGESAGVRITGGAVRFTGIDKGKGYERTELSFDMTGPAARLMAILDRPPLGFARYLHMAPERLEGTIAGTLTAAFPPIAELALDDIEIAANGEVRGLVLPGAAFDQDLTDGRIRFEVGKTRLELNGEARLAGAAARLNGDLRFAAGAPFRSKFRLRGTLDDRAREALGFASFPFSPDIVRGPVTVDMTATEQRQGGTLIAVAADLSQARLALAPLGWDSPAGEYAALNAEVRVADGRLRRLEGFRLTAPQLSMAGEAEWPETGDAGPTVRLGEFRLGGATHLTLEGKPAPAGGYRLSVTGPRLDARPLLDRLTDAGGREGEAQQPGGAAPLTLDLTVGSVLLGDGPPVRNLHGLVRLEGEQPREIRLDAATESGGDLSVELKRDGALTLRAADAGALLVALGITERLDRGVLRLDGRMAADTGGLDGRLVMLGGAFRDAPFLMRFFGGAAAEGPDAKRSWSIDRFETDFSLGNGVLMLEDGRVTGGELGATFQGWIDLNREVLDLSGAMVPVYSVNRVLQAIPLIGTVLTGGEGLFAANYRATGRLDGPDFSVNPLTALAPGLLRNLFGGSASAPPGSQDARPETDREPSQPNFISPPDVGE